MTPAESRPPEGIDVTAPTIARAYDYALFGKDHWEADRELAHAILAADPTSVWMARQNRAYLIRVVRFLAETCGIRQFIDHGSGLPTRENVHQIAQRHGPGSRVVYIDNDPLVLVQGRALLPEDEATIVVTADMSRPEDILGNPEVGQLIDFDQPVGLLYISVLHCLKDAADPWGVVRRMLAAVPSGSYLAISTITAHTPEHGQAFTDAILAKDPTWGRVRTIEEINRFFDGVSVVEPGLGDIANWRLDLGPAVLPRPDSPENPVDWPPEWGDDVVDPNAPKTIWEHGGVGCKP